MSVFSGAGGVGGRVKALSPCALFVRERVPLPSCAWWQVYSLTCVKHRGEERKGGRGIDG